MKHIQLLCTALLLLLHGYSANAQCNPDITPPVAICDAALLVSLGPNGEATIWASNIDDGSYDSCTAIDLFIEEGNTPSPTAPTTTNLTFDVTDIGNHTIILWAVDQAGNSNQCFTNVEIINNFAQCNPDVTPPTSVCVNGLIAELQSNDEVQVWAQDIDDGSFDNCPGTLSFFLENTPASNTPPTTEYLIFDTDDIGTNEVAMWVTDQAGISNHCIATIEVTECQNSNPNLACNDQVNVFLNADGTNTIYPSDILEGGPYCFQDMGIDFDTNSGGTGFPGLPFLNVDTTHIGSQVVVVYDQTSGNSCWSNIIINGFTSNPTCNPDITLPVAVCDANMTVALPPSGEATIFAETFDDGSYDNCPGGVDFFAEIGLPPSPNTPTAQSVTFNTTHIGMNHVVLWVVDQAGNTNQCFVEVEVKSCFYNVALACNSYQTVGIPASGSVDVYPLDVLDGGPYCTDLGIGVLPNGTAPGSPFVTFDTTHIGTVQQVAVYDQINGNTCWSEIEIIDCQNDMIPPVMVCLTGLVVEIGLVTPHEATIWAHDFDDGSYDDCSPTFELLIETGATPSAQAPTTPSLTFDETQIGIHDVFIWGVDGSGNENHCSSTLEILAPDCNADNTAPICIAPANTAISQSTYNALGIDPNNQTDLDTHFGQADADDNCGVETILKGSEVHTAGGGCSVTSIERIFTAIDSAGNASQPCTQFITITPEWIINLPADHYPGDPVIDSLTFDSNLNPLVGVSWVDTSFDFDCDGNPDLIHRQWSAANWCSFDPTVATPAELPRLDNNGDGQIGDAYDAIRLTDSIYVYENGTATTGLTETSAIITYLQILHLDTSYTLGEISGTVFVDDDNSCDINGGESPLAGWTVVVKGLVSDQTKTAVTDATGQYQLEVCPTDTLVEVSLDAPFNYGATCGTTFTVSIPDPNQPAVQDIPVEFDTLCPTLFVDIATPFLRRCFDNQYTVSYCNYSDATVTDIYVEVQLDTLMTNVVGSLPMTDLGGGLFSFDIGDLTAGECGMFDIDFDLDCLAPLGATHCVEAHIYPDTLCPVSSNWTGANIEVEATCENDTVFMKVKNTGLAAMAGPLEYIVVEDVIMRPSEPFELQPNEEHPLAPIPADGSTFRIEAEQEPGHPYPGNVAAAVEGCNGVNVLGLINLFNMENPSPFIATDCQQNIGSFDPNDKRAFPLGYGNDHLIEQNTDIEYMIRFQNTGTDTAFNIRVLDQLDPSLDPTTVRPGAASHPYQYELIDDNVIRFSFNNIMLPDSNINEAASHGFVQFNVSQRADVPLGTVIENDADIYFDFNDPIITNLVTHTIGEHFVEVNTGERPNGLEQLKAYPNPSAGDVTFEIPVKANVDATFLLFDGLGQQLMTDEFNANKYLFKRNNLAPGIYFYQVELKGIGRYTGKVVLK